MSQFFRQAQDPVSCATHAWGAVAAFFGGMVLLLRALWPPWPPPWSSPSP